MLQKYTNFLGFLVPSLLLVISSNAGAQEALPQLELTYDASKLNYYTYIEGRATLTNTDGLISEFYTQFKTRGATAQQYKQKPSLNMKLRDADGKELDFNLLGLRKASSFILDAMAIDRINMRNRVCFDIWNEFSRLPYETDFDSRNGTVGKFVELFINGQYKGIYCVSDKINRKLLDLKKPKVNDETGEVTIRGALYKHGTNDLLYDEEGNLHNQETPGMFNGGLNYIFQWHDAWELHEPDDYPCIEAWAPMLDLYDGNNFSRFEYVKEHFYLENLADYAIHLMALCIQDNWGNKNKYFSVVDMQKDGDDSRIVVTPWDLDTSLGGRYDGSYYDGNYATWSLEDIAKNAPLPFGAAFGNQDFKNLLKRRWLDGRQGALSVASVSKRLYDYCDLFEKSGAWERSVNANSATGEKLVTDLRREIDLIVEWYADRFDRMDRYFNVTDEDINAVGSVTAPSPSDTYYNLQGIKVAKPAAKGLYILPGKGVIRF